MTAITTMSAHELREHIQQAQTLLHERRDAELHELKDKILELVEASEFTFDEVAASLSLNTAPGKKVRFRHPDDPSLTWSGRGRRPDWIGADDDLETFRVG